MEKNGEKIVVYRTRNRRATQKKVFVIESVTGKKHSCDMTVHRFNKELKFWKKLLCPNEKIKVASVFLPRETSALDDFSQILMGKKSY